MVEYGLPSSSSDKNSTKAESEFTFTANPGTSPHEKDVDIDDDSMHHTLGKGPTQAAAGNHKHKGSDITDGIVKDHGALEGLGDDDHSNYPLALNGTRASGTWPISITGNADSVDGQHFGWSNPGTWPTYFWGVNTSGQAGFLVAGSRVPRVFTGAGTPSGQKTGDIWAY